MNYKKCSKCSKTKNISEFRYKRSMCKICYKEIYTNKKSNPVPGFDYVNAAAKKVYRDSYSDGNLTFDQFKLMTSKNCVYCNSPPSNKASIYLKNEFVFIYSGLDRLDNNKRHDLENVVPCCKLCNRIKSNKTLQQFFKWISDVYETSLNLDKNK